MPCEAVGNSRKGHCDVKTKKLVLVAVVRYALLFLFLALVTLILSYSGTILPPIATALLTVTLATVVATLIIWMGKVDKRETPPR